MPLALRWEILVLVVRRATADGAAQSHAGPLAIGDGVAPIHAGDGVVGAGRGSEGGRGAVTVGSGWLEAAVPGAVGGLPARVSCFCSEEGRILRLGDLRGVDAVGAGAPRDADHHAT